MVPPLDGWWNVNLAHPDRASKSLPQNRNTRHHGDVVRVLTWNVWGRNGPWEARLPAIHAVLAAESPDVVCFQEAWSAADGPSLATTLGERLGLHAVDADQPPGQRDDVTIGNAVLSRFPVIAAETTWLPRVEGGLPYRTLLRVEVDAPGGPIAVHCTHLDWQYDAGAARIAQARAIARHVGERRGDPAVGHPPVLAGDLNAVADADEIRLLTGRTPGPSPGLVFQDAWEVAGDGGPGLTWSRHNPYCAEAAWPQRRIDYVMVAWPLPKPLGNPVACRVVGVEPVDDVQPSDHYAVVADLA
jgi:endonuclease/exonuclease/phosphatase family metal-dependent hydrolase